MPSLNEASNPQGGHAACASATSTGSPGFRKSGAPSRGAYWRSLEEFAGSPEFMEFAEREFPAAATDLVSAEDRRQFIKVMGASFALAGLALSGCRRWPEQKVAPFAHRPADRVPGGTQEFATSMELDGTAMGLVVTSFDGRPIKVDGNPDHPASLGAADVYAQASILSLYDEDRSREVFHAGGQGAQGEAGAPSSWGAFESFAADHFKSLAAAQGAGLGILCEPTSSPTVQRLKARLLKAMPKAVWAEYAPLNDDNERLGSAIAFGAPRRVHLSFAAAEEKGVADPARPTLVVLSLDADFLADHPEAVRLTREFAKTRRAAPGGDPKAQRMSRLYMLDSGGTLTGVMSDERVPLRALDVPVVAAEIAQRLLETVEQAPGAHTARLREGGVAEAIRQLASSASARPLDAHAREVVDLIVADLAAAAAAGTPSMVVVGRGQPPELHALGCLLNELLGNVGRTVRYTAHDDPQRPTNVAAIRGLRDAMAGGAVTTLVILGGNPVYNAPADLDFAAALARTPTTIHCGYYRDETARRCLWHLPRPHYLESWGDGRSHDGTYTVAQPLIAPMIDPHQGGLSVIELLARIASWTDGGAAPDGEALVRGTFAEMLGASESSGENGQGGELDRRWRALVHDGFLAGSAFADDDTATVRPAQVAAAVNDLTQRLAGVRPDQIEVVFRRDAKVYDGRFANNGWLQELPEPITKITWDNAAVMSMATAQALGVSRGDMVQVDVDGRRLEIAAWVLPGHPDNTIWLTVGYGRGIDAGRIADAAGFDTYRIRSSAAMSVAAAAVTKASGWYPLVHTQDRGAGNAVAEAGIQERLPTLVREGTLSEFHEHPDFAKHVKGAHVPHRLSLWEESNLDGARHRWAMSVDLSTCTGCNACVIACQAENNIPIVGKEQVRRGREMHWIRIDRYFRGDDPAHPERTLFQPVTCMHCENAACEQVCPVAATVHDEDGLNVMVYNRCVGTRYCSNNCPYKVRRFNYFDWHRKHPTRADDWIQVDAGYYVRTGPDEWKRMQFNPEVTVRMRGVMEKCTFCVQRIEQARIKAKNEWAQAGGTASGKPAYTIPDGAIVPACAQTCPADAIVFGDLNDPTSRVSALHKSSLAYEMLAELNPKTRLKYLARLCNPAHDHGHGHGHDHGHGHGQAVEPASGGRHARRGAEPARMAEGAAAAGPSVARGEGELAS